MTKAVLEIRLLAPADWRVLRDTRLRALIDSPEAFLADYGTEQWLTDDQWRQRLRSAVWVVALERGFGIGIAGLVNGHRDGRRYVESVWVAPTHRNRGVFQSLLGRVTEIGRGAQLSALWLWVMEDNPLAQQAYERAGFRQTGERKLADAARHRFECRMRLAL